MEQQEIPQEIVRHLTKLADDSPRAGDAQYGEQLFELWRRKAQLFVNYANTSGLELTEYIAEGSPDGFLTLTYSGSLLAVGPDTDDTGGKWMEYSSIKLRTDVPDLIADRMIGVDGAVNAGHPVKLFNSRISSTSSTYLIAKCPSGSPSEEQDKLVREASIFITTGFLKYNRSVSLDRENVPDQFTTKSMTRYLAKKHGLTGNQARLLIDDFCTLVETGMLLGESVPMGKIGRFSVKIRDAQSARVVKHPATGEDMVIDPKPPMGIPKISFSSYLKNRAAMLGGEDFNL